MTNDHVAPFGRLLIASLFLLSGLGKIAAPAMTQAYIASTGLPLPVAGYLIAVVVEIAGSLLLMVGYRTNNIDDGKSWSLIAHVTYRLSATLGARLRFDSIYHQAAAGRGFTANTISVALTKTFE